MIHILTFHLLEAPIFVVYCLKWLLVLGILPKRIYQPLPRQSLKVFCQFRKHRLKVKLQILQKRSDQQQPSPFQHNQNWYLCSWRSTLDSLSFWGSRCKYFGQEPWRQIQGHRQTMRLTLLFLYDSWTSCPFCILRCRSWTRRLSLCWHRRNSDLHLKTWSQHKIWYGFPCIASNSSKTRSSFWLCLRIQRRHGIQRDGRQLNGLGLSRSQRCLTFCLRSSRFWLFCLLSK